MIRAILSILLLAALMGCSSNKIVEAYTSDGALQQREWHSTQFGTTRQATLVMDQSTGTYRIQAGEEVDTSENFVEVLRVPANTASAIYGMGQLRRGDALAPVSVNQAGSMGLQSQPINETQGAVYAGREETERELARIAAELELMKAATAHEAAPEGGE